MNNKYKNGKIYKLTCDATPIVYYGSTIRSLKQRLNDHKSQLNCSSKELFEMGNVSILLIEEYPCNSKKELETRERIYIEFMLNNFNHKIICNKIIPCRTKAEYYQENRDKLNEKSKIYHQENKEKLKEKKNEKFNCGCGIIYSKSNKLRHLKSKKHLAYISAKK